MTLPGTFVTVAETAPSRTITIDTGTWFAVGVTDKGPRTPVLVRSRDEFVSRLGGRRSDSVLYDAVDTYFHEGGARAYIARVVGPGAVSASVTLKDGSNADTLRVDAIGPGAAGDTISVEVAAAITSGIRLVIRDGGSVVETSPDLADKTEAVAWAANSSYVLAVSLASTELPAIASALALTGGDDDISGINDAARAAALARFNDDLGPGQVSMPGMTTAQAHIDTLTHAATYGRRAILDAPDTATVATLVGAATAARSNGRYGAMFAPWATVPGVIAGIPRTVPYSAVEAGIIARNDADGNPNQAAAGQSGQAVYATGLSQPAWTNTDLDTLNTAGVNVARIVQGGVRTFGYRSLADPNADPKWAQFTTGRTAMAIVARAKAIGDGYDFAQIDGAGLTISRFGGELTGMLSTLYLSGALYGATPADAFSVNVGASVNTPETIQAGQLRANIAFRDSPYAERVEITLVLRAITETVA